MVFGGQGVLVPFAPEAESERMLPLSAVFPLVLFTALLLALSLHALAASGHFPRTRRGAELASGTGSAMLYGSMAIVMACLLIGLGSAWHLIPWYAAVIGGGLAILVAPLVLQQFPDRFVDGRASLLAFAAASLVLALALIWLAARTPARI
jgi:hypothetical protein